MAGTGQFASNDLLVEQPDCKVFVGDCELGAGTIKITERLVCSVYYTSCMCVRGSLVAVIHFL